MKKHWCLWREKTPLVLMPGESISTSAGWESTGTGASAVGKKHWCQWRENALVLVLWKSIDAGAVKINTSASAAKKVLVPVLWKKLLLLLPWESLCWCHEKHCASVTKVYMCWCHKKKGTGANATKKAVVVVLWRMLVSQKALVLVPFIKHQASSLVPDQIATCVGI